jgi:hypothetical protein
MERLPLPSASLKARMISGGGEMKATEPENPLGFGHAWLALTVAFALHVIDEASTGFLHVYNPTVTALRQRWDWFPMPTFGFRQWITDLATAVVLCFALTPLALRGVRILRPFAWAYAIIHLLNAAGHTAGTILGHTVVSVTFSRPAPGFYSSPLLFITAVWLVLRLWKTRHLATGTSTAPARTAG